MGHLIGFPRSRQQAPSTEPAPESAPEPLWREVVGRELREERHRQGRTLADVAGAAGVSTQYLSEVERGRKEPSSEVLGAIRAHSGCGWST